VSAALYICFKFQFVITGQFAFFERLRAFHARSGRIVGNPEEAKQIAVPSSCIWKGSALILRRVGADKPMGVYTGVALNAA
jgi:hypothetical protein